MGTVVPVVIRGPIRSWRGGPPLTPRASLSSLQVLPAYYCNILKRRQHWARKKRHRMGTQRQR